MNIAQLARVGDAKPVTSGFGAKRVLETGRRLTRVSPYCQNTRIAPVFRIGRKAAVSVSAGGCDPKSTPNRPITDLYPAVSTPSRIAYPRIRKYGAVSAVSRFYACLSNPARVSMPELGHRLGCLFTQVRLTEPLIK